MNEHTELAIVRRAYAKQVLFAGNVVDALDLERAFSEVKREDFLGEGPWPIFRWGEYRQTPSADPVYLYTNDLIGIVPEQGINNGEPSLHAHLIYNAKPGIGEHVVHIGAGVGYYTAIMAELVGASGKVTAIEFDPELTSRAEANLKSRPQVAVMQGNGATASFSQADAIYVNAGMTRPANSWLDSLTDGGRLILPLTTDENVNLNTRKGKPDGGVFRIERRGTEFHAKWISPVAIIPGEGARDADAEAQLRTAFENGGMERVRRLYRDVDVSDDRCWLRGSDWCLAYS